MATRTDRPTAARAPEAPAKTRRVKPSAQAKTRPDAKVKVKAKTKAEPLLSRLRRPEAMDAADWQRGLRRQFGRQQAFALQNLGAEPVFSDFEVFNPASQGRYRVVIRGAEPGSNTCTCPDFASNQLGTCKHIEFTLGQLLTKRGTKAALQRG